jgi:hypothetical protein
LILTQFDEQPYKLHKQKRSLDYLEILTAVTAAQLIMNEKRRKKLPENSKKYGKEFNSSLSLSSSSF